MKRLFRVLKTSEFQTIINSGTKIQNKQFTVFYLPSDLEYSRFGISVSKKRGNAVTRNKIKRQVRMMIQTNTKQMVLKRNVIIIVKNDYLDHSYSENESSLIKLLQSSPKGN